MKALVFGNITILKGMELNHNSIISSNHLINFFKLYERCATISCKRVGSHRISLGRLSSTTTTNLNSTSLKLTVVSIFVLLSCDSHLEYGLTIEVHQL